MTETFWQLNYNPVRQTGEVRGRQVNKQPAKQISRQTTREQRPHDPEDFTQIKFIPRTCLWTSIKTPAVWVCVSDKE